MSVNLNIRRKLLVGTSLVAVISVLVVGAIGYWATVGILRESALNELNNEVNLIYGQIHNTVDASIKNYLRSVAEKDKDIVTYYYQKYKKGQLTEAEAKAEAARVLLSQRIGKSGYVYVVNSHGVLMVHPKPALVNQDISSFDFVQQQIKNKYGYVEYQWKNPGEKSERPKALYMDYFAPWDWIISASSYREEFNTLVNIKDLRDSILSIKIGKTGYPYIVDTKGNLIIHPAQEGQNIYNSKDDKGNYFIREMIKNKNGQILYPWKNPGESSAREKIVIYKYLPELDYIVAAGINLDDLYASAGQYNPAIAAAIVISVLLALAISIVIARSFSRPIISLKQVSEEIAAGDYSKQAPVLSRDEIGDLARAFNKMVATVRKNFAEITDQKAQIEAYSKELEVHKEQLEDFAQHLEGMVGKRTAELEHTNEELRQAQNYLMKTGSDLKRLLDNTGQGFLYFNEDLLCGNEYSAECLRLFAAQDITGCSMLELLFPADEAQRSFVTRIMDNIFTKGPDMREVYLSLLPAEITLHNRVIQLEYKPISRTAGAAGDIAIMMILTDITEKRALEQKMEDEKNILRMVVTIVGNYRDFKELINDYRDFCCNLEGIAARQSPAQLLGELYVSIHTFKGNFSQLYMTGIVARLHDLESAIVGWKQVEELTPQQVRELLVNQEIETWLNQDLEVLKGILGESFIDRSETIEIEIEKLHEIEQHVETVFPPDESRQLLLKLRRLRYQPFRELLRSYPDYVDQLAQRLGKSINPVIIEQGDFLVDPDNYHDFAKALVHVFRNSVDHGIETPDQRLDQGKEEFGTIICSAVLEDGYGVLTIADDGRGLDIEKLKERAVADGICSPEKADSLEPAEACQLIFAEGVSTAHEVTDLSGRGVGLNAVSIAVRDLHGRIEIQSHPGEGTAFRFILPCRGTCVEEQS